MNPIQLANIKRIQDASRNGRLVLFVGAGVSKNSGVPMWGELIEKMKNELPESVKYEKDDLKLAQLYKDSRGKKEYMEMVKNTLCHNKVIPNPIHKELLALNPVHIITTNYDDLIEQEIRNEYKQFAVVRSDKDMPNMIYPNALIKMHGDYTLDNIVLAENDYYNYAKTFALTRAFVQSLFASKLIVFVGFSFADINLKIILNDVKNILEERMQPVYMLSLNKPDWVTQKYFESKGINIIFLEDSEATTLMASIKDNKRDLKKLGYYGIKLYNYLKIIEKYDSDATDDLITYVYQKVAPYQDEIVVYGSGLKYLFPTHIGEFYFNEHSDGLQTGIKYFDRLAKDLATLSGKKKFINKYGIMKCRSFILFAFYNYLHNIDDLNVLGEHFWNNIDKYVPKTVSEHLCNFDFSAFEERLRVLSSRRPTGTIEDMEYPYAFYKIGAYYKAYKGFEEILPMAWKRQKYILYFLCLYNMWSLRFAIRNELSFRSSKPIDWQPIYDKLSEIDLYDTLSKLPLPQEIRKIFHDLLANRYIGNKAVESEELKEKVHQQRKLADRGGFSINSNISALIAKHQREKLFGKRNFILSDFNKYDKAICRNTASGILNSYATTDRGDSESEFHCNTRIESLDDQMLAILIFGIDTTELRKMFRQYDIYSIEIDQNGQKYIVECIENLRKGIIVRYQTLQIMESVKNLIYIIGRCVSINIDVAALYEVIDAVWGMERQRFEMKYYLDMVIDTHNPTPDFALQFLLKILDEKSGHNYSDIIKELCEVISKSDLKIDNIEHYISLGVHEFNILPLYWITPDKDKPKMIEYGKTSFKDWFPAYVEFLHKTQSVPDSVEDFEKRLSKWKSSIEGNNAIACKYMVEWRKNKQYEKLWEVIDKYREVNDCMQFFTDPINYPSPEKVHIDWITTCSSDIIKELITQEAYSEKLKNYISDARINPRYRRVLMSVF
ncbi:MAG: SIR2 family protein [Bacteroides sp.]|nr:SIR2 family protein [Muribaculum sp.]MCM1372164.1 SIR2 family protein [Bacteroides sp.]